VVINHWLDLARAGTVAAHHLMQIILAQSCNLECERFQWPQAAFDDLPQKADRCGNLPPGMCIDIASQ
jgi:hypothetical protein